jgi:hypothetical protein
MMWPDAIMTADNEIFVSLCQRRLPNLPAARRAAFQLATFSLPPNVVTGQFAATPFVPPRTSVPGQKASGQRAEP